jgi:glutathione synthase/RimK-type ligase-like ATP-grasp enzyme
MTKQVYIITSSSEKTVAWKERERYVKDFCKAVERQLERVSVRYITYDDLQFIVQDGTTKIIETKCGLDLKSLHLVHFKNWAYKTEEASLAAAYLKANGVLFLNSEVNITVNAGKLSQMFHLAENGIPVPDTFYTRRPQLHGIFTANKLPTGFTFPLIMKDVFGSRGDNNYLIKTSQQALAILADSDPEIQFILQNFIQNDGDYRILFFGSNIEPVAFHRQAVNGTHLNNTSKGGIGRLIPINELPPEFMRFARKAVMALRREIGGVDIIIDSVTGQTFVLEVNGTPALATGYQVGLKTQRFAALDKQILEIPDEKKDSRLVKGVIGRVEHIRFLDLDNQRVPAKIDTGADMSSIWVSNLDTTNGELTFTLFGKGSPYYTGKTIEVPEGKYGITRIANSFGKRELRYVVKLRVEINGRIIKVSFSLADRSSKTYPVLLGRKLLNGKFLVDVSKGEPLSDLEKAKKAKLRLELKDNEY